MTDHGAVDLSGQRVLVVGSATLIGVCRDRLVASGASVVAVDSSVHHASPTTDDWEPARRLIDRAVAELGGLDVVVTLVAGDRPLVGFLDHDPESMAEAVQRLLLDTVAVNWAALEVLGPAGRLINVVSHTGLIGASGSVVYDACQAAVASLGRNIAQETGRDGRTVVTVSVGELAGAGGSLLDRHSLGRFVEPSEVADMVCVAASDLSTAAHGSMIGLSGGLE